MDEFSIALSPVLFGAGVRLFDGIDKRAFSLAIVEAINSPMVTHLAYAVQAAEHKASGSPKASAPAAL